jgi:hypothetical protein
MPTTSVRRRISLFSRSCVIWSRRKDHGPELPVSDLDGVDDVGV